MRFVVSLTRAANRDLEKCYAFIAKRSRRGADSWATAFQKKVLNALPMDPHAYGLAPESVDHPVEIRESYFRTRMGKNYRVLFTIRGRDVLVIHIRGPGQDLVRPDEMELP